MSQLAKDDSLLFSNRSEGMDTSPDKNMFEIEALEVRLSYQEFSIQNAGRFIGFFALTLDSILPAIGQTGIATYPNANGVYATHAIRIDASR